MAKRSAQTNLNHDNWNDEEIPEDAGQFIPASQDVLKKREIKVAKRRSTGNNSIASSPSPAAASPFTSFAGFQPMTPSSKPVFNITSTNTTPKTNGFAFSSKTDIPNLKSSSDTDSSNSAEKEYAANLSSLNKSVSDWIKLHVDKSPMCILTPVFSDYERHLKEIRAKRDLEAKKDVKNDGRSPLFNFKSGKECNETNNQESKNEKHDNVPPPQSSIFGNFNAKPSQPDLFKKSGPDALKIKPFTANIGKTDDDDTQPKPFSFGGNSKPFTFSNVSSPAQTPSNETVEPEEENEEPPKSDFQPVKEDNALYSKRCKVFVKKDGNFSDRGIGTLYIKKVNDSKHQLLVRADTVLGNILVNVLLSSDIPTQRMGKNNVVMVCLPTPDASPPPTSVLLRVKTSEEADELLKSLEQYKN
uniref:RanBD1 domain-containing protein n=1 Tax=Clastoptera arizonana TaxID=38151 RepID=A0A1B6E577_9HEMI